MGTVLRSTTRAIATAIKTELLNKNVLPSRRIVISARLFKDVAPKADHFIAVRPNDLLVDEDWAESKGRHATKAAREFCIDIYTRLATDDILKDEEWVDVHLDYEDGVMNVLHIWQPYSGSDALTVCPIRLTSITHPEKGDVVPGWGVSTLNFRADYLLALSEPFTDPAS